VVSPDARSELDSSGSNHLYLFEDQSEAGPSWRRIMDRGGDNYGLHSGGTTELLAQREMKLLRLAQVEQLSPTHSLRE
jgi:hypothetical protein